MSTLDSILQLLNKWPAWKRITDTPDKLDKLEGRLAALEEKLRRAPGEACPKCGEWTWRVVSSQPSRAFGDMGVVDRLMRCEQCGFEERKMVSHK